MINKILTKNDVEYIIVLVEDIQMHNYEIIQIKGG